MTPGLRITIRPLTLWARNKVRQHGDTFIVRGHGKRGVLLESIGRTYKGATGMETWLGWFQMGSDAEEVARPAQAMEDE